MLKTEQDASPLQGRFRRVLQAASLLCALAVPAAYAQQAKSSLAGDITAGLKEEGLTGAVWTELQPDGNIVTGAAGLKNAASGLPMQADTRVQVGSVAKVVLALGVLHLVSEGKLTLDTPLDQILPQLALKNPWQASDPVRMRHLLAHTAGLDDLRFWQAFSSQPLPDTPLAEAFAHGSNLLRVHARPGSRYAYSNMGYGLLGMVIEKITGQPYERYLDTQVLQPLGMADSTFAFVTQAGPQADPRLAMGHFERGITQTAVPMYLRPAGQFTTTAGDMGKLAQFLMGDGQLHGSPFIAAPLMAALSNPVGTQAALAGLEAGHGLALATRDRHNVLGACHPGTTVGFRAMLCVYPEQKSAFFVAFNTDSEIADYERFNRLLMRDLELPLRGPAPSGKPAPTVENWEGVYLPSPGAMSSMAWVDTVFGFVRLKWDGDDLYLIPFQGQPKELEPLGGLLFRASDRSAPSHVLMQADGRYMFSDGLHTYERASMLRMLVLWGSAALGVAGLLYLLLMGLWRAVRRKLKRSDQLFAPLLSVLALLLPVPFFVFQSFLRLGDVTMASVLLAIVTGALPLAMAFGLARCWRGRQQAHGVEKFDWIALLAALQWLLVLAWWGLLPLLLWQL
ncbi:MULTISPECIES: serine hydrolase [unclassified Janthinobacterium]|uniref:serine hydrolase domain-containing protein n=1 Tax=unclassified Janthinobacterium TaxID=2610881 RepID=UPI001607DFEE|nr:MULTISPECIES: serine hydrolase domain-containing protein [unclassified Janthinobacterium]MBB5609509.1 CubicO group peptidase (beta-lactamase class C family) [Janthinobacterium sp. S3T4]MBB5614644.1 CubicO group peptidase (beta-lactamase class C family) [Janthinobacterium sp. S3M3]